MVVTSREMMIVTALLLVISIASASHIKTPDKEHGYGRLPSHPLTSDDPHPDTPSLWRRALIVSFVGLIMIVSTIGNGFLVKKFICKKKHRSSTNTLIVSQCCADLLLSSIAMPLYIASQFTVDGYLMPHPLDLIQIFVTRLFMTITVMHLSAIAVDRLSSLSAHDKLSTLSKKKAIALSIIFWGLATFISLPLEIAAEGLDHYKQTLNTDFGLLRHHEENNTTVMTAPALRTIILCSASVLVIIYCFIKLIVLIKSRKYEVLPSKLCNSGQIRTLRLRVRSAYTVMLVFLVFFISTLPLYTMFLLTVGNVAISPCLLVAAKLLSWSSTATKPLIFIKRCKKWQGFKLLTSRKCSASIEELLAKKESKAQDEMKFFSGPVVDFTGACVLNEDAVVNNVI